MLLSQTEAREKWCPMVRMVRFESGDPNARLQDLQVAGGCNTGGRAARVPQGCRCIASDCAMWRFQHEPDRSRRKLWYPRPIPGKEYVGHGPHAKEPGEEHRDPRMPAEGLQWIPRYDGGDSGAWVETNETYEARQRERDDARKGWCGLAGTAIR